MTDEENTQYDRMCLAVLAADEMMRRKDAEIERLTVFAGTQTDECARLRADHEEIGAERDRTGKHFELVVCRGIDARVAAESRLADATALLEWLASELPGAYRGQINGFLRNQPAAPARLEPAPGFDAEHSAQIRERMGRTAAPTRAEAERWYADRVHAGQTAAPAPTEAVFEVQGRSWPAGTHPTRTEAEQAVLDAMGRVGHSTLLSYQPTPGWLGDACRAELARRGLK